MLEGTLVNTAQQLYAWDSRCFARSRRSCCEASDALPAGSLAFFSLRLRDRGTLLGLGRACLGPF
jgi:hypothetical protein